MGKVPRNQFTRKPTGIFRDTIEVHTAPSGTQYVRPIDVLFPDSKMSEYVEEAKRARAAAKSIEK